MGEAAAKEPSMEDILSSIRKIIADDGEQASVASSVAAMSASEMDVSDPVADPAIADHEIFEPEHLVEAEGDEAAAIAMDQMHEVVSAPPEVVREPVMEIPKPAAAPGSLAAIASQMHAASSQPATQEMTASAAPMLSPSAPEAINMPDETDSETVAGEPDVPSMPDGNAQMISRSLADIAASAKMADSVGMQTPVPSATVVEEPTPPESVTADADAPVMHNEPEARVVDPVSDEFSAPQPSMADLAASVKTEVVQPAPEPAPAVETISMMSQEPTQSRVTAAGGYDDEVAEAAFKGALMSPSPNGAVSSSFDRLKRSVMDDLEAQTEAILRPMLREWLDDNLPNLVERLVREEIERVARG